MPERHLIFLDESINTNTLKYILKSPALHF